MTLLHLIPLIIYKIFSSSILPSFVSTEHLLVGPTPLPFILIAAGSRSEDFIFLYMSKTLNNFQMPHKAKTIFVHCFHFVEYPQSPNRRSPVPARPIPSCSMVRYINNYLKLLPQIFPRLK